MLPFDWFGHRSQNRPDTPQSRPTASDRSGASAEELRHLVHEEMAHKAIPSVAFTDPVVFLECLRGEDGPARLQHLWKGICDVFDPEGLVELPGIEQFQVSPFQEGSFIGVILGFPQPARPPQAHFASFYARVHEVRTLAERAARPEQIESWYVTLERAGENGTADTKLGGWTSDGRHLDHGPGPQPNLALFLKAIETRMRSEVVAKPADPVPRATSQSA
jgi:hypothetical protein